MLKGTAFAGANVFMSRKLVPPEVFDALLDALKLNGAEIILCCDPSRNGSNDYHVISSPDHEKYNDLRAKGCHLLGPQCVLMCAKERRALPRQGFVCCLAMDGAKVLSSGFNMDEKAKVEMMVVGMGGLLLTKPSSDVNFVVVKDVLASKYKWALNVLKKPIVTICWLQQCWEEHRVVPQEPYRVPPLSGLIISVTKINPDERKDIEKIIIRNGGKYSPELTKMCTHLIANAPEGDKYKVARRWGHIHIVTRKWFEHSVARKVCLNEENYPVQVLSLNPNKVAASISYAQEMQNKSIQEATSCATTGCPESDIEATLSQNMSSMFSDPFKFTNEAHKEDNDNEEENELNLDDRVANDSQSDGDDEYLSECIIALVGFEGHAMQKLVNMVRRGGGSQRFISNSKLTHIVVGAPTETEKTTLRNLAASGVINVVKALWLEDCDREKKEVDVLRRHAAYELLMPKDSANVMNDINQYKASLVGTIITSDHVTESKCAGNEQRSIVEEVVSDVNTASCSSFISKENSAHVSTVKKDDKKDLHCVVDQSTLSSSSPLVFKGKRFRFSDCFPEDRRAEIVEWIDQGGGRVANDSLRESAHFTVECHGVKTNSSCSIQTTYVSTHWIKSCLEVGSLLDIKSHILYEPLPCKVPMPGFEKFRFCISQYDEKDRSLMRNLCFVLGTKLVEKLTKKVTHLLCKFASGPKFQAACKWGICTVTCEWVYECIRQNNMVAVNPFHPVEAPSQDLETQFCSITQLPTQPDSKRRAHDPSNMEMNTNCSKPDLPFVVSKKPRCSADNKETNSATSNIGESVRSGNDVAASIDVIEGLYELAHEKTSIGRAGCEKNLFSQECSDVHDGPRGSVDENSRLPKLWNNRTEKGDEQPNCSKPAVEEAYNFSETQTDSQVVGYEEDLSGRQMLIDRVRLRSSFA